MNKIKRLVLKSQFGYFDFSQINCIDFSVAALLDFYHNGLFLIYCAYVSIYENYIDVYNYQEQIYNEIGLNFSFNYNFNIETIITNLINNINNGNPTLVIIPSFSFPLSIKYKERNKKNLDYAIIINGYDDDKKLLYYYDSNLNASTLHNLIGSNGLLEYQMSYDAFKDMIIDAYNNNMSYSSLNISIKNEIDVDELNKKVVKLLIDSLENKRDVFVDYISSGGINNEYILRHFLNNLFVLKKFFLENSINTFVDFFNKYQKVRKEQVFQYLIRKKISKELLLSVYENNYTFSMKILDLCFVKKEEHKLLDTKLISNIIVDSSETDSCNYYFSPYNVFVYDINYVEKRIWKSKEDVKHFFKIDFVRPINITIIEMEFIHSRKYVLKDFDIIAFYNNDLNEKIFEIRDNTEFMVVLNKPINNVISIKMNIDMFNSIYDLYARIRTIKIYI